MGSPMIGKFSDVAGLSYQCGSISESTGSRGEYKYTQGEEVSFSIGPVLLGTTKGKPRLTILDLVDNPSLTNSKLLNRARLLFSLTPGLGFEQVIQVDDKVRNAVSKYATELNLDSEDPADIDSVLNKISVEIGIPTKSVYHVRNHVRRALAGFRVLRDIRIPVRNGNFVFGDVYLPLEEDLDDGEYPVLVSCTVYGKRVVYSGPVVDDPEDVERFEKAEDDFHSTTADVPLHVPNTGPWFSGWTKQRNFETIGTFNTFFWVPRGYAMVKIDPRGVGQTPGSRGVLVAPDQVEDFIDSVEWASEQPWSTGNVATAGNSYGANLQWPVAAARPKGLKAAIPYATDVDWYRDCAAVGGIPAFAYLDQWHAGIQAASPRWQSEEMILNTWSEHPFYDDYWEKVQHNIKNIDIPIFTAAAQMLIFHHRGPFEAWKQIASKEKHLHIVDTNYFSWPNREVAHKLWQFAERHLKGKEHGKLEPIGVQMRIGHGDWYWRTEPDWEVPGTYYVDWHLHPDGTLSGMPPTRGPVKGFSYPADIDPSGPQAGASFLSLPFAEDVEVLGHFAARLNISSTSHDADVVVAIWVLDERDKIVRYGATPTVDPLACGLLRASRRVTDPEKSLPWRPWHTHLERDNSPLKNGEVVKVDVEICPVAGRIRAGWRLRVDILPSEAQPNIPDWKTRPLRSWIREYHDGATNTLHVGGDLENYIRIPVVPVKTGELNKLASPFSENYQLYT